MPPQLYNEAILAEAKARHGHGRLAEPELTVTCDNPLCGDRVTVDLRLAGDRVGEFGQTTRGCVLTQAAASLIGRRLAGAPTAELHRAASDLRRMLAGEEAEPGSWSELAMFTPVRAVSSRHECVLLPFEAVEQALLGGGWAPE
jgi:nitrogen fixation protein NifU and related proteins